MREGFVVSVCDNVEFYFEKRQRKLGFDIY